MFKKVLELIIDVDDIALKYLTKSLQSLRKKDVAKKNMGTVSSYVKRVLLFPKSFSATLTDVIGLLNDLMVLVDCAEFVNVAKA